VSLLFELFSHRQNAVGLSPARPNGATPPFVTQSVYYNRLVQERLVALAGHFFQRGPVQYIDDAARVVDSACDLDFARDFRDRCPTDAKHFGKKFLR